MRTVLRWLLYVIPLTLIVFILSRSLPRTFHELNPLLSSPKPQLPAQPFEIDSIKSLWRYWSTVLDHVRPDAAPVKTRGQAGTTAPDNKDGDRTPYADLVRSLQSDLNALTKSHADFVQELGKVDNGTDLFEGKGVVVVGGGEYFGPAIIGIHMLRRSGSTLPVEIFVADDKEYNAMLCEDYLPKLNARCLILSDYLSAGHPGLKVTHYQLKSLALLFCSFADVLLLDSDSMSLVDPERELFSSAPYVETGFVIWPDFWTATESPKFYSVAGLSDFPAGLPQTSSETGQLLLNKKKHLKTLLLATYYNVYGPDYYYPLLSQGALGQGDKETFMAAAVVLNTTYHRVHASVRSLGRFDGQQDKGTAMVQMRPGDDERPAFLHANTPKMNAGHLMDEGDIFTWDKKDRLRLLGSLKEQEELFGLDLEKTIWELLVQTGCELASVIREWKSRDHLCDRLEEHYRAVFIAS